MPASHRGRPRRLRALAPLLASILAVALVVGAIVLVDVLHHSSSSSSSVSPPSSPVTTPATQPSPVGSTPTPTATHTSPKPTPTASVRPTTHPTPTPIATPAPQTTPVAVYNNSRVGHRASLATSRLRAAGYPVSNTATRLGYPGANVVYYPPGNASLAAAAAGVVARNLGIVAAEPRPASIPATAGLIVVVTSTYR